MVNSSIVCIWNFELNVVKRNDDVSYENSRRNAISLFYIFADIVIQCFNRIKKPKQQFECLRKM